MGVEHGFVRKSGSWFTYDGDQLGQGKENARTFLRDNPDLANELEKRIKEKLGVGAKVDAPADAAGAPEVSVGTPAAPSVTAPAAGAKGKKAPF
jgi:recombination protein RecA